MQSVGTRSDVDAIGVRVRVSVAGRTLSGDVQGGSSYLSQSDPPLHFGLGQDASYERIEVRWSTGEREQFGGGKANQSVVLKQGTGVAVK